MSLDETVQYDEKINVKSGKEYRANDNAPDSEQGPFSMDEEHPHITHDGEITEEGTRFIISEFGRLYGDSPAEAMKFYSKINRKAKKIIERNYFLH
jgi:hypothetical protein